MPKRTDLRRILIIGSGPIVIGQACEFDYSGTQACKALRAEGYEVVLVNSNPATIMTDPDLADRTYIEPLTVAAVGLIIARERPDALLPTVGGQTGLNLAVELAEAGLLDKYGVELIGAKLPAVKIAEDRRLFKRAMQDIGLEVPRSDFAGTLSEAEDVLELVGLPAVIRPSFTLGGSGGGIAYNAEEFREIVRHGLALSPIHEVLIEESVIGWKEFELEVMRDLSDNVVVICSIENFDPMGVHTGDSITVAPAQTLTDREYQALRDAAIQIIRKVGVETGGSNIQFAVNAENGRIVVIEMNPRVSRSSALASKATGYPIAKIAAKLAVGYTLAEIPNDITRKTPASFEPTLDYVVVKIPKWAFEKFPGANSTLGTQMKSVGEVMAIGRTFKEAFQKALRSLETGKTLAAQKIDPEKLRENLVSPSPDRLGYIRYALADGMAIDELYELTRIDRWFLQQFKEIVDMGNLVRRYSLATAPHEVIRQAKQYGFSDLRLMQLFNENGTAAAVTEDDVRQARQAAGIRPIFKRIDTCSSEFESYTPYFYSTYESECEAAPTDRKKIIILGSGPNRIGQGIEFDYCCCHAAFALKEAGYETIMVNCNPETISTDYDTSDRLYFEPLTVEDVLAIVAVEKPDGVIVQFGGQTPLNLALRLQKAGVPIIGTSPQSIDLAEDRKRFGKLLARLGIPQPKHGTARSVGEARKVARQIGYPVLIRPSYVLGGRAMVIAYDDSALEAYVNSAVEAAPNHPILIDKFLEDAFEYDVDALCDGRQVVIGAIMEHIEEAGIHSGDSSCVLPPIQVEEKYLDVMRKYTRQLGLALKVRGLMNVQYAMKDGVVYVLEVNPRASRTVPFVSKATGVPLAKIAACLMVGQTLRDFPVHQELAVRSCCVKTPVFPFIKFPGVDTLLGPEMRSTGEVMGIADDFGSAFAKAQISAGTFLPERGTVFISVNDYDKKNAIAIARDLADMGFSLVATKGTCQALLASGIAAETIYKVNEGRPHVVDWLKSNKLHLVINTPLGRRSFYDEGAIRRAATQYAVPCITTLSAARAAVTGMAALRKHQLTVCSLQEYHERLVRNGDLSGLASNKGMGIAKQNRER
ncbi:MAG: carbamoyl-phosphate synthase large subunit [Acidobacteria bacterium]|nr:carbamoyl-phosphate synthase large subunit [Acidobacteriota bacterium]MBI3658402.1 carbamoyl-phosphate synthase large subunit [Acidobacteriota bacterium]